MWADGEITGSEANSISDHISQCSTCSDFVSAQKQMESVWRKAWIHPADADFETMRRRLKPGIPWWQTRRAWYIAATVCAVYLGIRIFHVDGAGTSLSEIAAEETSVIARISADEVSCVPEAAPMEEMIAGGCEGMEQEIEILQDELAFSQSDPPEIVEESLVDLSLSVSDSESAEEEEILLEGDYAAEYVETAVSLDVPAMECLRGSNAALDNTEDAEEKIWGSGESFQSVSDFSTESAGFGVIGGSAGHYSAASGVCSTQTEDTAEAAADISPAQQGEGYSVSLTLESGEVIEIQRDVWDALFSFIDLLQHQNCYSAGKQLVFMVSSAGIVSGPDVPDSTVIDIPETGYGNCAVTVLFH